MALDGSASPLTMLSTGPLRLSISWALGLTAVASLFTAAHAYIPAFPTNLTLDLQSKDASHLTLQWIGGGFAADVSQALASADSKGVDKGLFVHFSEAGLSNDTTTTPWVALVACDANITDASMTSDIFTLARERGAVAALLFSAYSERCVVTPEHADPNNFDHVLDVFAVSSHFVSSAIGGPHTELGAQPMPSFNASALNASANAVNATLTSGIVSQADLLFALLVAPNVTGDPRKSGGPATVGFAGAGSTLFALCLVVCCTLLL